MSLVHSVIGPTVLAYSYAPSRRWLAWPSAANCLARNNQRNRSVHSSLALTMEIKAGCKEAQRVLNAAMKGSIKSLEEASDESVKDSRCNSGKTNY